MLVAAFMMCLLIQNAGAVDVITTVGSNVTFDLPSFRTCPNFSLHDPDDILLLLARTGDPKISEHTQTRTKLGLDDSGTMTLTLFNVSYNDEGSYYLAPIPATDRNPACERLYVITIKRDFEGTAYWLSWEPWSSCRDVTSCVRGLRQRTRDCSIPTKCFHGSGTECEREVTVCIQYAWSPWSDWSGCSVSCGSGRMRKHRKCLRSDQSEASSSQCMGEAVMEALCAKECTTRQVPTTGLSHAWTTWGEWGDCSVSCGSGWKSRYRKCVNAHGREVSGHCDGERRHDEMCSFARCLDQSEIPSVTWTFWGPWTACSVACGSGWQIRDRKCIDAQGREVSGYCGVATRENTTCNKMTCQDLQSATPSSGNIKVTMSLTTTVAAAAGVFIMVLVISVVDLQSAVPSSGNIIVTLSLTTIVAAAAGVFIMVLFVFIVDLQSAAPSSDNITVTLSLTTIVATGAGVFIMVLLVVIVVLVVVLKRKSRRSRKPSTIQTVAEARTQMVETRKHLAKAKQGKKGEMKIFTRKKSEPRVSRISEFHVYAEINDADVYSQQPAGGQGQGHGQGRSMSAITIDNPYAPLPRSASPVGGPGGHEFDFSSLPLAGTYMNEAGEGMGAGAGMNAVAGMGETGDRTRDRANKRLDSAGYLVPLQGLKSKVYTNQ